MKRHQTNFLLGILGSVFLTLLWLAGRTAPEKIDKLLRPYGLFILFGALVASIVLPAVAAIRGSKWWFLVVAASLATAAYVFWAVMT
jgi:hypothetical protein